ncbi:MAG: LCP family protein [Candidatus Moranbacteria bacterium]|nr:LCP family protein [Candidatus Moranbacteria bacterium]
MNNPFKKKTGLPGVTGMKKHHKILIAVVAVVATIAVVGGFFLWRAGSIMQKISGGKGNIFSNVIKSLPGTESKLKGEADGRINILLLGERGEHVDGGGLLTDTIMVLSIHPSSGEGDMPKASLVSIPRDLYVTVPGTSDKQKINAVHYYGEQKGKGQGMEYMKQIISDVTGQSIQYAMVINFKGFEDLVDAVGGVTVHLDQAFAEGLQFHEPQVCDPYIYTVPTKPAQYQFKYYVRKDGTKYVTAQYALCYNKDEECGGVFSLPAGDNQLNGEQALCYARARKTSNDFERAKRQQEVIKLIKAKALSAGLLTDFSKVDGMMSSLGENVRTDMEGWELKRLFDIYQKLGDAPLQQKVLDTSEEGLLYFPSQDLYPGAGSIILPIGDSYDRIRELFKSLP